MSFNSAAFLIFLPVTVFVHYLLPHKVRWVWLLAASYFFYMSWRVDMALLILAITLVSYLGGLLTEFFREKKKKVFLARAFAWISGLLCASALIYFKYFGFIAENINRIASLSGGSFSVPDIILPVGVSFYTFQALSYVIDTARGRIKAERHIGYYALFVSFFPQLVAGPIERPDALIPQLKKERHFSREDFISGVSRILVGFFKKIAVADMLAIVVDKIYASPKEAGGGLLAAGTVLFAVQIFCDFSGYTDIAAGAAEMLGVKLSKNFDKPYSAVSVQDFWRRWHMSLSGWFRDYVYFPLGGSKKGEARTCFNLIAVFFLSGLWHGASWHFVVWGLLHALFMVFERVTAGLRNGFWKKIGVDPEKTFVSALRRTATFISVCFLWIFFRAGSISGAWEIISTIFSPRFLPQDISQYIDAVTLAMILLSCAILVLIDSGHIGRSLFFARELPQNNGKNVRRKILFSPAAVILLVWVIVISWLLLKSQSAESAFIYFIF